MMCQIVKVFQYDERQALVKCDVKGLSQCLISFFLQQVYLALIPHFLIPN